MLIQWILFAVFVFLMGATVGVAQEYTNRVEMHGARFYLVVMITAPILQSGIEVDVPKTRTVKEINQERLVVTVDKAQRIYLGNEPINIHQLGLRIKAHLKNPQEGVFLRCDETVPFGSFAAVVDALRQSGINNISIVTEPITARARTQ